MSNAAAGVLKDALREAEADRDKVAKDTEKVRAEGARAQALVDAAEERVHELTVALDMLSRPEAFMAQERPELRAVPMPAELDGFTVERPEVEDLNVGGVRITRRSADG